MGGYCAQFLANKLEHLNERGTFVGNNNNNILL